MKKIICLLVTMFLIIPTVFASDNYFFWHDSVDDAYSTNYAGYFAGDAKGTYEGGAIEAQGNNNVKITNLNVYDIMLYEASTWTLSGTSTVNTIEQSSNSAITIKGSGTLRVKSIGLGMEDMINVNSDNYAERLKSYLKGDYTLTTSGDYLVISGSVSTTKMTTTTTSQTTIKNTTLTTSSTTLTTDSISDSEEKIEITTRRLVDDATKIYVSIPDHYGENVSFKASDITDERREEISKLTSEEIIAIYDFSLINRYDIFYPDDVMQVFIPMESEAEYAIYYYDGSSLEKLNSTYTDGELIFSTSHFSEYVITKIEDKNVVDHQNRYIFLIGFIVLAIIIIAMIIIVIKKRHKKTIQ